MTDVRPGMPVPSEVELVVDAAAYEQLRMDRHRTLVAPEDDMWATFADLAVPHAIMIGDELVGRFSVDDEHQLHAFFVTDAFEPLAPALFARVVGELGVSAAIASTVDPLFLALSLSAGGGAEPVALLYDHVAPPTYDASVDVRLAVGADHAAAVEFARAATGSPDSFLVPYLEVRIGLGELYLVEIDGAIVASGECRVDQRTPGQAHLGLIVGADRRGHGLGSRLLHTLTEVCHAQDLRPLCSTEPTNLAAQKAIRRAGFRNRHHVFRVDLSSGHGGR